MFETRIRGQLCLRPTKRLVTAGLMFILSLLNLPMQSWAQGGSQSAPGELLVGLHAGVSRGKALGIYKNLGAEILEEFAQIQVHRIKVSPSALDAVARALSHRPEVQFVERNGMLKLESIPNDVSFSYQWHLPKISAPAAWDITTGSTNIIIAIVDTGVDPTHPDLVDKLVPGYNAYNNNNDTSDAWVHGTKVAGTAAAASNNGIGVSSVAWHSPIMPIRITDASLAVYYSVVANGVIWAADHNAKVINLSISGVAASATVTSAANYARQKGAVVVASGGNCGCFDTTSPNPSIISVSATDSLDNITSWSSRGGYVDVAAPGDGIYTTANGGGYVSTSGTSFSSPVTAGVIALIMAVNPNLSPTEVQTILQSTADDLGPAGYDTSFGHGRINAYRAVLAASTVSPPSDTVAPVVSIISPANNTSVSGGITVSVSASDNVGVSRVDLYIDGQLHATDNSAPFSFFWDTTQVSNGSHSIAAIAYDAAGNFGSSSSVTVSVSNGGGTTDTQPPSVVISTPVGTATNGASKLNVSVSATDNVGVVKVELYVDGVLVATDSAVPYSFSVNTRKLSSGSHTLQAKAYDPSGNVGVSQPSTFTR